MDDTTNQTPAVDPNAVPGATPVVTGDPVVTGTPGTVQNDTPAGAPAEPAVEGEEEVKTDDAPAAPAEAV